MVSNESLVCRTLSGSKERTGDNCLRFVNSPEGFLLNTPAQEYIPHEENVGNHSLVIGDSCTVMGLVGSQDRV